MAKNDIGKLRKVFTNASKKQVKENLTSSVPFKSFLVENAGLIITHPFLKPLFENLQLIEGGQFDSYFNQEKAAVYLHYLVFNQLPVDQSSIALNKIICGIPLEKAIDFSQFQFSTAEIFEAATLKEAIISHWAVLKNTSNESFTASYLQRNGVLNFKDGVWTLAIERKAIDILLNQLPWELSIIRFPWSKNLLQVSW